MSLSGNHSKSLSKFIFRNGTLLTGTNNDSNPPIFIIIDIGYMIDSGKTNEYHPKNSPNARSPKPAETQMVPLFRFSKYDSIVSIAPYASKMNEIDLKTCSI